MVDSYEVSKDITTALEIFNVLNKNMSNGNIHDYSCYPILNKIVSVGEAGFEMELTYNICIHKSDKIHKTKIHGCKTITKEQMFDNGHIYCMCSENVKLTKDKIDTLHKFINNIT